MSFLNKINVPLISSKITAVGRQKIAEGSLNFKYYAFGDSQAHYAGSNNQHILKPKDKNPNLKTFLTGTDCAPFQTLEGLKVLECCLHNKAKERGFFDETDSYKLKLGTNYIKKRGEVLSEQFNGSKYIDIQTTDFDDGDIIVFKLVTSILNYLLPEETVAPVPYLFYKITKSPTSTIVQLDRNLPYLTNIDNAINYYILDKDVVDYSTSNANILWDYEDLNFKIECLEEDTYIWNFNIIWGENVIGTQPNQQQYTNYCSFDYLGQKEYLGYDVDCPDPSTVSCEDKLLGIDEDYKKAIGIIHYTNNNKSNLYGEYFYIANPSDFRLVLQSLMWHRRYFAGGSGTGDVIGMTFVADTTKKYVSNTNIAYYDLVEDSSLIDENDTPLVVGRIYADLQIIVIHHPDLLAAMSYKSNRNFTLPKLAGKMIPPSTSTGILEKGKTMFVTYTFEADNGIQHILPQQQFLKFINNTLNSKDVEFYLEKINYLPYMRQKEAVGYDGLGFSFHRFKVLYQIVNNGEMPVSENWLAIDYTNNFLVDFIGNTINPIKLETQNPTSTGFTINLIRAASATTYNLSVLGVPDETCPDVMGFGCENILFGNIDVEIGACVYKSIIELVLDSDTIVKSTNPTWSNQNLKLTEIGIYDDQYNLVWINNFYKPIEITENTKSLIEIQIDF
jgi:hypothetical protein